MLESAVGGGGDRVSVRICVRKPEELSSLPPGPPHLVLLAPELLGGGWPGWGGPAGKGKVKVEVKVKGKVGPGTSPAAAPAADRPGRMQSPGPEAECGP